MAPPAVGHRPFGGAPKDTFEVQRSSDLTDPRFEGADISTRLAQIIRKMGRADPSRRYRRWHECVLDLMLAARGSPPFAAQLSEALAPHTPPEPPADDAGLDQPGPGASARAHDRDTGSTLPSAPGESTAGQLSTATEPWGAQRWARRRLWLFLAAVLAAGLVGGVVGASSRPSAADVLEHRARELAAEGRVDEAVHRLRQAALLLSADGAAQLRATAKELEPR